MLSALRYITGYGPSDAAGGTGGFGSTDLAGTSYTHGYSNGYDQVTVVDDEDDVLSAVKSGSMNALRFLLSDGADAKITDEVRSKPRVARSRACLNPTAWGQNSLPI